MTTAEAVLFLTMLCLATIVLIWAWIPPLFHLLGFSTMDSQEDPSPPLQRMEQPDYQDFDAQLRALGFEAVGGYRKTVWYFLHHWTKSFHGRVFLAPDRRCYAMIAWLHAFDLPRVRFGTLLGSGALLETSNALEELRIVRSDRIRTGHVTRDLKKLLAVHQEQVTEWSPDGSPPHTFTGLADAIAVDERVERTYLTSWPARLVAGLVLVVNFGLFAGPGLLVANSMGEQPCTLPAAVLTGAVGVFLFQMLHFVHIRTHRQAELCRARPDTAART
jgi:hypothetical protein